MANFYLTAVARSLSHAKPFVLTKTTQCGTSGQLLRDIEYALDTTPGETLDFTLDSESSSYKCGYIVDSLIPIQSFAFGSTKVSIGFKYSGNTIYLPFFTIEH